MSAALEKPIRILKHKKNKNEFVVETRINREGKNLVVAIHGNKKRFFKNHVFDIHRVASIYPKRYSEKSISDNYEVVYP